VSDDRHKPSLPGIAGGLGFVVLGVLLLLDATGDVTLSFGVLAPVCIALCGAVLIVSGLSKADR
jgi:hypothetical protein